MPRRQLTRKPYNPHRPFRGATPSNVFQTVDLGSGMGTHMLGQATRHPNRKYAVVDKEYSSIGGLYIRPVPGLKRAGIRVYPERIDEALNSMIHSGIKTRHLNLEMPFPDMLQDIRGISTKTPEFRILMNKILVKAPQVLVPNGKLFITTEIESFAKIAEEVAKEQGFTVRRKPTPHPRQTQKISEVTRTFNRGNPIFRLEITFSLRKAFPDKKKRLNWPRN